MVKEFRGVTLPGNTKKEKRRVGNPGAKARM
jgi:hypothetical protein